MRRTTAGAGIVIEKNVSVTMSDGVTLRLNVFRPRDVVAPVVMSVTPYGKDNTPDRIGMLAMRLVSYSATPRRPRADRVSFTHRFAEDTEITGSMALTVWMSTDQGTELDVFVVVRKRDTAGQLVGFYGYNGYPNDGVAKGWLRASHRELDPSRGRPERPFHTHRTVAPVEAGKPVELTVEIWPSSTYFEAGSELIVEIVGHDADRYPVLRHVSANRGTHIVHTGGLTPSALVAPLAPNSNRSASRRK
jgi:predicted acyl esterase